MTGKVNSPSNSLSWQQVGTVIGKGALIAAGQAPVVNPLNLISSVSSKHILSFSEAHQLIRSGRLDEEFLSSRSDRKRLRRFDEKFPNFRRLQTGLLPALCKEGGRSLFKPLGIFLKPKIDHHFNVNSNRSIFSYEVLKANAAFATALSVGEVIVQPLDTLRVMAQSGARESIKKSLPPGVSFARHLMSGCVGNVQRQALTWFSYPYAREISIRALKNVSDIDPNSLEGIALRAYPCAFMVNMCAWPFESLKNRVQFEPQLIKEAESKGINVYRVAFQYTRENYGLRGFTSGFSAKTLYLTVLVLGADYIQAMGVKNQQLEKK